MTDTYYKIFQYTCPRDRRMVYMDTMGNGWKAQQSFEVARYTTVIIYCLEFQLLVWNGSDKVHFLSIASTLCRYFFERMRRIDAEKRNQEAWTYEILTVSIIVFTVLTLPHPCYTFLTSPTVIFAERARITHSKKHLRLWSVRLLGRCRHLATQVKNMYNAGVRTKKRKGKIIS